MGSAWLFDLRWVACVACCLIALGFWWLYMVDTNEGKPPDMVYNLRQAVVSVEVAGVLALFVWFLVRLAKGE